MVAVYSNYSCHHGPTDGTASTNVPYKTFNTDSTGGCLIVEKSDGHGVITTNWSAPEVDADVDEPKVPQPLPVICQNKPTTNLVQQFKKTSLTRQRFGGIGTKNFHRR